MTALSLGQSQLHIFVVKFLVSSMTYLSLGQSSLYIVFGSKEVGEELRDLTRRRQGVRQMRCWPSQWAVLNGSNVIVEKTRPSIRTGRSSSTGDDCRQTLQERLVSVHETQVKRLETRCHPYYDNAMKVGTSKPTSVEQVQRDRLEARMNAIFNR